MSPNLAHQYGVASYSQYPAYTAGENSHTFMEHLNGLNKFEDENNFKTSTEPFYILLKSVREYFDSRDWHRANVMLDILIDEKFSSSDKQEKFKRNDGLPGPLHELNQVIQFICLLEHGYTIHQKGESKDDIEEVQVCNILSHDLGEDLGITPDSLESILIKKGVKKDQYLDMIKESHDKISKHYGDKTKAKFGGNEWLYYCDMEKDRFAALSKLFDNVHNMQTFVGGMKLASFFKKKAEKMVLVRDFARKSSENFPFLAKITKTLRDTFLLQDLICNYAHTLAPKPVNPEQDPDLIEYFKQDQFKSIPSGLHPMRVCISRTQSQKPHLYPAPSNGNKEITIH